MDLSGKNAVVTGAGGGIGRGIALALADAGANVVAADIEETKAKATAEEVAERRVKSGFFRVDVRNSEEVGRLADYAWETLGRVDVLCNNAGVVAPGPALSVSDADFRWQLEVNVVGVFNGMREFTRRFIEQGGDAHIVNTGSHHSIGAPTAGVAPYVACKHAVLGLADAFRTEYGDKVKFSVLCPGIINTGIWDAGRNRPAEFGGAYEGDERNQKALTAFGMRPERVGRLVANGIQNEDFFIWTHPQDIELIEKRYNECRETLESQWPDGPDEEHKMTPHDVT
ncbi:SDR family NAD(P)-dependent oxidoreductase [Hyphomonas johnsonii]|uniref:Short-chain dehydrogenase/reductase SDR n=1 Tax=Hyphomonas johnsonii MHS-2 TaxID=1280950 RepID=A0A059FUT6_9PROT|nr:SDR family NAD(P)-dependent oxidoreductase [Hyphomonas johnsonii]KCZ94276.1 short-chain dehydrogenase/reductase SDR [Hyphomonas johnsonii MHS-2]